MGCSAVLRPLGWVALLSWVLALALPVRAQEVHIADVTIVGNERSDEALIREVSGLTVGERIVVERFTDSVADAVSHLYKLGIFSDVRVVLRDRTVTDVYLEIQVDELPSLEAITFSGNDEFKTDTLRDVVGFVRGQAVGPSDIHKATRRLLDQYEEKGYLLAEARAETPATAIPGRVELHFDIEEGKKVQVKRITFVGNAAVNDDAIKKSMETKEDRWYRSGDFKREMFEEDKQRIAYLYRTRGYRDGRVVRDSLAFGDDKASLYLTLFVDEGQLFDFGDVTWDGNTQLSDIEVEEMMLIQPGELFNQELLEETYQNLLFGYQEKGYLAADVRASEIPSEGTVGIHFEIEEGSISRIRTVKIVGNTRTKEHVIRRELSVLPGQTFRRGDVARSQRDIFMLNFFADVKPQIEPVENGDVDLSFEVTEKQVGQASLGAGYSERDKAVGTVALLHPNFLGNGQRVEMNWDFGSRRETLRLGLTEPWLLGTPTSGSFELFRQTRQFSSRNTFDERRKGGFIRIGKRLEKPDFSRLIFRYRFEEIEYLRFPVGFSNPFELKEGRPRATSAASTTFTRDSRDFPQFPTQGSQLSYLFELAGGLLGGHEQYIKHIFDAEMYMPAVGKAVFLMRGRSGLITSYGDGDRVPLSERFTPGGVSFDGTIRGYADRSVGPFQQGLEIGGETMVVGSVELRFPLVQNTAYGLLFADAGNAWLRVRDTDPFDLKRSLGLGVRVATPILGLIGFDFGYGFDNVDAEGVRKGRWRSHFQFGLLGF